jgi:hypothetical protein
LTYVRIRGSVAPYVYVLPSSHKCSGFPTFVVCRRRRRYKPPLSLPEDKRNGTAISTMATLGKEVLRRSALDMFKTWRRTLIDHLIIIPKVQLQAVPLEDFQLRCRHRPLGKSYGQQSQLHNPSLSSMLHQHPITTAFSALVPWSPSATFFLDTRLYGCVEVLR